MWLGVVKFFTGKNNLLLLGISTIFTIFSFQFGSIFGKSEIKSELSAVKSEYSDFKKEHNETVNRLVSNANLWKASLESAQRRARESSAIMSRQSDSLLAVTNQLKQNSRNTTIVRELKNECKASDIIVNTDTSDRLRNCLSSSSPESCAGGT